MKFIQYTLSGEIVEQYSGVFDQLEAYLLDQKVRVTMDNDHIYARFWDTAFEQDKVQTAEIS